MNKNNFLLINLKKIKKIDFKMADAEEKKTNNWAEMSDDEEEQQEEEVKPQVEEPKKVIPPPRKGTKNKGGDYVVTTLDIPDFRDGVKKTKEEEEEDSDSDEGYGDEEDVKETPPVKTVESPSKYFNQSLYFNQC